MCFLIKLFCSRPPHVNNNFNYAFFWILYGKSQMKSNILIRLKFPLDVASFPSDAEALARQIFKVFNFRNNINQTFKLINTKRLINYN